MIKLKRALPRAVSGMALILGATLVVTVLTFLALTDHGRLAFGLTVALTLGIVVHCLQRWEEREQGAPKRVQPAAVLVGALVTVVGTVAGTAASLGILYLWFRDSGYRHEELAPLLLQGWLAYLIALGAGVAGAGLGGFVAARLARQRELLHATAAAVAALVPGWLFLEGVTRTVAWRPDWWSYAVLAVPAALLGGAAARDPQGRTHLASRRRPPRPGATDGHPTPPEVRWTLSDLLLVNLYLVGCGVLVSLVDHVVLQGVRSGAILRAYSGGLLELGLPILWLWHRYGIPPAGLGLRRGALHPVTSVALGIGLAGAYHFLVWGYPGRAPLGAPLALPAALLLPLTLQGFSSTILKPLSEEVMLRGFIYPYLRHRWGSPLALLLQALLFSGLHSQAYSDPWFALHAVLIGLLLGILYEKTQSLYPAITCHGALNYLTRIGVAL